MNAKAFRFLKLKYFISVNISNDGDVETSKEGEADTEEGDEVLGEVVDGTIDEELASDDSSETSLQMLKSMTPRSSKK